MFRHALASLLAPASVALVGATVHTGQGPPLENATIVIDGARVHAVGAKLRPPDGATVIDVSTSVHPAASVVRKSLAYASLTRARPGSASRGPARRP